MKTEEVLRVEHLRKQYKSRTVLKDVSFTLEAGTATALVGPLGAGKTTLFRILAGTAFPDAGNISLFESSSEKELRKARQQVGFLVDKAFGENTLNVEKNLCLLAGLYGKPDIRYIRHLMKQLKLTERDVGSKRLSTLIGSVQARYALATALVHKPRLLVLDEPLTDIHTDDMETVFSLLSELKEEGTAMLISGQGANLLQKICSQTMTLNEGVLTSPQPLTEVENNESVE